MQPSDMLSYCIDIVLSVGMYLRLGVLVVFLWLVRCRGCS
jgi:hypothetical protein